MAVRKLDRHSGLEYTETAFTPRISSLNGPSWVHETPFLPTGWEELSDVGAPSLMHSAMRTLLSDQRKLTPSLFANVPWRIASYLWDCLGRSNKRTLHAWKIFATAYPTQFTKISGYRSMKIEGPKLSMQEYLGLVKSDSLSWRVVLTLAASYARVPELVGISEIKNLVALEIATPARIETFPEEAEIPATALSDRIVRTWSELAQETDAFPYLRVLVLQYQTSLSRVALRYLRTLPALQFVVAYECPAIASVFSRSSEAEGWNIAKRKRFPPDTLHEFYWDSVSKSTVDGTALAEAPILDFQVGQRRCAKANYATAHSAILLRRTGLDLEASGRVDPEPKSRKRKGVRAPVGREGSAGPRKAVMRSRTRKDLSEVLKDFL